MPERRTPTRNPVRRGFSLTELIAVMVILSALAFTAAPAVRSVTSARQGAMMRHVTRQLELARAYATATGEPTGVVYDSGVAAFRMRRIATNGGAPVAVPSPTGGTYRDLLLGVEYPAEQVTGYTTGDGNPANQAIWFSYEGTPEIRDADGEYVSGFTQDAVIETSGGHEITVRMTTGSIER